MEDIDDNMVAYARTCLKEYLVHRRAATFLFVLRWSSLQMSLKRPANISIFNVSVEEKPEEGRDEEEKPWTWQKGW